MHTQISSWAIACFGHQPILAIKSPCYDRACQLHASSHSVVLLQMFHNMTMRVGVESPRKGPAGRKCAPNAVPGAVPPP